MNPRNVLAAIFLHYPEEQLENDREKLHRAFSRIRKNHFDLLGDVVFRKNILFDRSKVLDEILACLQPEFLGKINPTYDSYTIKKDNLRKLWEKEIKASLAGHETEIEKMALELRDQMRAS